MIANDIRHIDLARRSRLALMATRWALNFSKSETTFTQRPYAAIRAPRSRRDKDMSDDKAFKQPIRAFPVGEFCISPARLAKIVTVTFLPWLEGIFGLFNVIQYWRENKLPACGVR